MAVTQAVLITRHPYADGSYKKMLIDGKWVDAVSGKKFETHNPATGELLATVAEGDAEDINRAVAAARRAFEGPWSKVKPFERQNMLLRLADLVQRNFKETVANGTRVDCRKGHPPPWRQITRRVSCRPDRPASACWRWCRAIFRGRALRARSAAPFQDFLSKALASGHASPNRYVRRNPA